MARTTAAKMSLELPRSVNTLQGYAMHLDSGCDAEITMLNSIGLR
jgi:hypothetical protein